MTMSETIVDYWPGEMPFDPMSGWYIIMLEDDGTSFDAIGPYECKSEAERILEESKLG